MALDTEVIKAVKKVVDELGQPNTLAERIVAWLEQMSSSDMSKEDELKQLNLVRRAIKLTEKEGNL